MGSLYKRGQVWWIQYYREGKPIRESARTQDKTEARRILREREGQVAKGERPTTTRGTWADAAADLMAYYHAYGSRNPREASYRMAHLDRHFLGRKLVDIDAAAITAYVVERKAQWAANGTINAELITLRKALKLAQEHEKLGKVPAIKMLKPAAPREGFFEREQVEAVCRVLPDDLRVVVCIGYLYGWRVTSEVLPLAKRQVDLEAGTLRLEPGTTKNGEGRLVYLTPELTSLLEAQLERVRALERETGRIVPHLFPNLRGPHKGRCRVDFLRVWQRACVKAGCPGILRHDLRRSAVRNLVNLGVSERVAMQVTGHKTRSIFDQYHVMSPGNLKDVARRLSDTPGTISRHNASIPT